MEQIAGPRHQGLDDRGEHLQFLPAVRARGDLRLDGRDLVGRERLQGVQGDRFRVGDSVRGGGGTHGAPAVSASAWRSLPSPERIRVFTVPSGSFNRAAASRYVSSEKNEASMACRSGGE